MEKAQESWGKVKSQCMEAISAFQKNEAEIKGKLSEKEAEEEKDLQEERNKALKVCRKFDKLRNNPLGGCEGDFSAASLYKEANEVAFFINKDPQILKDISDFDNLCGLSQNESQKDTEVKKDDTPDLVKLCQANGNDWNKVKKKIGHNTYNNLTENNPDLSSKKKVFLKSSLGLSSSGEESGDSNVDNSISNILDISKNIFEMKTINFDQKESLESKKNEKDKKEKHHNICLDLDNYLRKKAKQNCSEKKSSESTCIEEEYGNSQKNLGQYRTLNSLIGDLNLSVDNAKGSEFSRRWINLGEEVDNPCITQNESPREEKDLSDVFEENINEMINEIDTINR